MPGFGSATWEAPILQGYRTRVALDVAEYQLLEPAWAETRLGPQMHRSAFEGIGPSYNVELRAGGWWGLQPLNSEIHWQHETTAGEEPIMGLSDFHAVGGLSARPTFKPPDAPGLVPSAAVKTAAGDHFFLLRHEAGESVHRSVVSALPPPPLSGGELYGTAPHLPVNRVLEGKTAHQEDTGYLLRWFVPGNPFSRGDITLRFYFGGPLSAEGHGQFCVAFGGGGLAWLFEYLNAAWVQREEWRFCNPQDALGKMHVMRILPHASRFLEFRSQLVDAALPPAGHVFERLDNRLTGVSSWKHEVSAGAIQARDAARRGYVTGVGAPRWDLREGLAAQFQVARLRYPTAAEQAPLASGQLVDYAVNLPWSVGGSTLGVGQPITYRLQGLVDPSGSGSIDLQLYNAATGLELTSPGAGQYSAPGGNNVLLPVLTFQTSDPYRSPWLQAYHLSRPAVTILRAPGEVPVEPHGASMTGTDTEPSHESASFEVEDLKNELALLRNRGMIPVAIRAEIAGGTEEEPTLEEITLFRGYTEHTPGRHRTSVSGVYPSEQWHSTSAQCVGMWARLAEGYFVNLHNFSADPLDESLPWKVTDVVRHCLGLAGFPDVMLAIPDHSMRLWAGSAPGAHPGAWTPQPGTEIGPFVVGLLWDYLGAHLYFDPQAGALLAGHPIGMWRYRLQPRITDAPLFRFVRLQMPQPETPTLAHMLGAYPPATAWIEKNTWQEWTDPPEANAVLVIGAAAAEASKGSLQQVRTWAVNPNSIDVPAFGTTAPPGHRDTRPGFHAILDVMPHLLDNAEGLRAAMWRCRRLYDVACRAWSGCAFTAPLALVSDENDAHLFGRRRLLRYGDPVLVDDDAFWVTSVNPQYEKDAVPLARYELQRFNDPVPVVL